LAQHSKRYRALREKAPVDPMPLADAIKKLKSFGNTKFNQTVEVSTNLGIDPRQSDQNVRGSVALPHGIGKNVRVAVFAQGDNAEKATAAGADIVGGDDLAQKIKGGFMDFDVALATPDMMGVVGPLGRVLGPRGLGGPRVQGGQDRVPLRQGGERRRPGRQAELHRGAAPGQHHELPEPPADGQAVGRQGDVHPDGHDLGDHEPGHPGRGVTAPAHRENRQRQGTAPYRTQS
jgi:hypothetical protein